jgi:transposase
LTTFRASLADGKLVALDESGFDSRATPIYAYAPKGSPAIVQYSSSQKDRCHYSLLMAIDCNGHQDHVVISESINNQTIASFIDGMTSSEGTTIVLDNAKIHDTTLVHETCRRKGYSLLFTPPYSPELNPIELVFGNVKREFYRARYDFEQYEDLEDLTPLITCIVHSQTAANIAATFRHVATSVKET